MIGTPVHPPIPHILIQKAQVERQIHARHQIHRQPETESDDCRGCLPDGKKTMAVKGSEPYDLDARPFEKSA